MLKKGFFDLENHPENFKSWLSFVEQRMKEAIDEKEKIMDEVNFEWNFYREKNNIVSV